MEPSNYEKRTMLQHEYRTLQQLNVDPAKRAVILTELMAYEAELGPAEHPDFCVCSRCTACSYGCGKESNGVEPCESCQNADAYYRDI